MTSLLLLPLLLAAQDPAAPCTIQRAELLPPAGEPDRPWFGLGLSVEGDVAAVGSPGSGVGGAVFLYEERDGRWQTGPVLEPPGAMERDAFGWKVLLREGRLLVTALYTHDASGAERGALFVYERDGSAWHLRSQVVPQGSGQTEVFGAALAASEDRIVVGAPLATDLGYHSGAAYVFRREGDGWVQEARLLPSPEPPHDGQFQEFGSSVAIEGDVLLVGAPGLGFLYCFRREGDAWELEQLMEDYPDTGFGSSLALQGEQALVGAPMGPHGFGHYGVVYVVEHGPQGWTRTGSIARTSSAQFGYASFGFGSPLVLDGDLLAVGTTPLGIYPAWGTWIARRTAEGWSAPEPVVPLGSRLPDLLGTRVALDGERLLVADVPDGPGRGRVFAFDVGRRTGGSAAARQGPGVLPLLDARRTTVGTTLRLDVAAPPAGYRTQIFGFESPTAIPLGTGTLLCKGDELLFLSSSLGSGGFPLTWFLPVPPLAELAGASFCAQALLRHSTQPALLTNAVDVVIGRCECPERDPD